MKIITKILNALLIILVLSGILFPILYFNTVHNNKLQYEQLTQVNDSLNNNIKSLETDKKVLKDSLIIKDAEINYRKEKISELAKENSKPKIKLEDRLRELSDMSLEQILNLLRDYYNTDSTEIFITTSNNTILVTIQPRLAREWANTITKLESRNIEVSGYKKQVLEYDLLITGYESKIGMLDSINVLNEGIIKQEREKNANFKELLDNRNKKIKTLKLERNAAGVIVAVVIVLAII